MGAASHSYEDQVRIMASVVFARDFLQCSKRCGCCRCGSCVVVAATVYVTCNYLFNIKCQVALEINLIYLSFAILWIHAGRGYSCALAIWYSAIAVSSAQTAWQSPSVPIERHSLVTSSSSRRDAFHIPLQDEAPAPVSFQVERDARCHTAFTPQLRALRDMTFVGDA